MNLNCLGSIETFVFLKIKRLTKPILDFHFIARSLSLGEVTTFTLNPNDNFIAVGFWNPNKEDLLRIRKELELDSSEFRELMEVPKFKNVWGLLEGEELKTAPKGFSKEDPNIDLIRKKMFLFKKKYTDTEVLASNFIDQVTQDFITVRPFLDYMSSVLTTDLNGVSLLEK